MRIDLFGEVFWGIYFVLIGLLALLKSFVDINIPFFRLAVGILLIYVGLIFAFGGPPGLRTEPGTIIMDSRVVEVSRSSEYNTLFGQGTYRIAPPGDEQVMRLKFNTVFGSTVIHLPPDVPVKVSASSAFGSVSTPDGGSTVFGERTYTSPSYREGDPGTIYLETNVVFGSLQLRY